MMTTAEEARECFALSLAIGGAVIKVGETGGYTQAGTAVPGDLATITTARITLGRVLADLADDPAYQCDNHLPGHRHVIGGGQSRPPVLSHRPEKTWAVRTPRTTTAGRDGAGELFVVVGVRPRVRLQITAGSPVAAAAAQLWEHDPEPMTVTWSLRDDLAHPRPVLLCTQTPDRVVHATRLVAGKPASVHPDTCCGLRLDWETATVRVCWPEDGPPCPACLTTLRSTSCPR